MTRLYKFGKKRLEAEISAESDQSGLKRLFELFSQGIFSYATDAWVGIHSKENLKK